MRVESIPRSNERTCYTRVHHSLRKSNQSTHLCLNRSSVSRIQTQHFPSATSSIPHRRDKTLERSAFTSPVEQKMMHQDSFTLLKISSKTIIVVENRHLLSYNSRYSIPPWLSTSQEIRYLNIAAACPCLPRGLGSRLCFLGWSFVLSAHCRSAFHIGTQSCVLSVLFI